MEVNRHLEAAFEKLITQFTKGRLDREDATELARAVSVVMDDEQAEDWASVLDDALRRHDRQVEGGADTLAEGPGQSGGAI